MSEQVPILALNPAERLWLTEVLCRNLAGKKFTFKEIWSQLHQQLPPGFRPAAVDPRLVSSNGEQIRLLGIIALQEKTDVLKEIDRVVNYIRNQLLADSRLERVTTACIAEGTALNAEKVSLFCQVINEFGDFYTSASSDANSLVYKDIMVSGSDAVYYQYLHFPGIEQLIRARTFESFRQPVEAFSFDEMDSMSEKLDKIMEDLSLLKIGQEAIWTDIRADIEELKALYSLGKKNWGQLLAGKIAEMVVGGIVSETVSKEVLAYLKQSFSDMVQSGGWLNPASVGLFLHS